MINRIKELDAFFRRCIEVGQARNVIPAKLTPQLTAKALVRRLTSIQVLGRGADDKVALNVIADQARNMIA